MFCKVNKVFYTLLVLVSAFSFFSCKNFLDGNQELQELQKAVDYANAPYVKVKFDCNPESLQLMVPSAGEVNDKYKAGDVISLNFEANDRYQFVKWTATPSSSVLFADPLQKVTTATILDSSYPITISQECAARPKIIGFSPAMGTKGVNSFEIIKVTFNQSMDESSIYWTYDELVEEITSQGKNVDDYLLVKAEGRKNAAGEDYYYCYRPKAEIIKDHISYDADQVFFKNIKITTKRDKKNKLCYFACPFFNEGSKTVLNIVPTIYGCSYATQKPLTANSPAQNQEVKNMYNSLDLKNWVESDDWEAFDDPKNFKSGYIKADNPDSWGLQPIGKNVEIYVELGSGFCYEYGSQKIQMNDGESWIYETSDTVTAYLNEELGIKNFKLRIWKLDTQGIFIHASEEVGKLLKAGNQREQYNVESKKILITGDVKNSLHGLDKITWNLFGISNSSKATGSLSVSKEGDKSYIDTILDLSDYLEKEGTYYLTFTVYDNNGKSKVMSESGETKYYFYYMPTL